jgi:hypothetical protein
VTDGESFLHDVHRHQDSFIEYLDDQGLAGCGKRLSLKPR